MDRYRLAFTTVFHDPFNLVLGVVVAIGSAGLFGWAGQIVTRSRIGGPYWDLQPTRLVTLALLSVGFGLVVPMQVEAIRQLRARTRARVGKSVGMAASMLGGFAAVSCCSPLLLPALAGLVGASGTTTLYLNLRVHRWFLPISVLSLALLAASGLMVLRDLARACAAPPTPDTTEALVTTPAQRAA